VIGVLNRIEDLADREPNGKPPGAVPYRSIVPLAEVVAAAMGVGPSSKKVRQELSLILNEKRTEFGVLLDEPASELARYAQPEVAEAILKMRRGEVSIRPGFDGEYGVISVLGEKNPKSAQGALF
jgi:PHP family Zn ribbon phosphoesterase